VLKPQDIVVALRLLDAGPEGRAYPKIAEAIGISASEAHAAVRRGIRSGLIDAESRQVRRDSLGEFLVHGLRYTFPAEWSGVTRGIPTSYAAPPLKAHFSPSELPPVWPYPEGTARGEGLAPLYKSVPKAAMGDPHLYEWLVLVDAVRAGRARERKFAIREIERRLRG
jgi:DNA-binding Lrp family transcriptional regulator